MKTLFQSRSRRHARLRARGGFTLAELVISTMIISVGVIALAGSSVGVVRQMREGNQSALAAFVAQSRMETIRSMHCSYATSGTGTSRGLAEKWVVTSVGSRMKAVAETVTYVPRVGVTKKMALAGVVPCV
jgi:Tfp pilus assembly protein PilV